MLPLLYLRGGGSERARARPDKTEDRMEGERKISHQDISHSTDRGERGGSRKTLVHSN